MGVCCYVPKVIEWSMLGLKESRLIVASFLSLATNSSVTIRDLFPRFAIPSVTKLLPKLEDLIG